MGFRPPCLLLGRLQRLVTTRLWQKSGYTTPSGLRAGHEGDGAYAGFTKQAPAEALSPGPDLPTKRLPCCKEAHPAPRTDHTERPQVSRRIQDSCSSSCSAPCHPGCSHCPSVTVRGPPALPPHRPLQAETILQSISSIPAPQKPLKDTNLMVVVSV